ncbi:MAG: MraY family glycosyltransferase, partial [Pseudomonadales bacterium]
VVVRYAGAMGLVDAPDQNRKVHSVPIPRAGGVAITLAFFLPALLWASDAASLAGFLAGAAIIAVFGFLDDRHNLDYKWKFAGQILGISIFLIGNIEITKTPFLGLGDLTPWLSYPLLALFLLGVTNAVNLSDGLDGLAAGSSLLSLAFIAFLSFGAGEYSLAVIAVSAMGALTGFLRFNTHPATVFMGDTGSQFLGYVTGCLAVLVTQSPILPVSPVLAILIVGLPILDTLMVMLLRIRDRSSPFKPDQRHLHHQFLAIGLQHYQAVAALYVLNFLLLAMAYLLRHQGDWIVLFAYLFFCTTVVGIISFFKHSAFSKQRRARLAALNERRNPLFRKLHWVHKNGARIVQWLLGGIWLSFMFVGDHQPGITDVVALAALLVFVAQWSLLDFQNKWLTRILFYIASVLAVYVLVFQGNLPVPEWYSVSILDIPVALLVLLLALVIRTTRRQEFRMDNQDMLVLLMLLATPLLTLGPSDNDTLIGAVVRLAVLLYASEYLITRIERPVFASWMAAMTMASFLAVSFI